MPQYAKLHLLIANMNIKWQRKRDWKLNVKKQEAIVSLISNVLCKMVYIYMFTLWGCVQCHNDAGYSSLS